MEQEKSIDYEKIGERIRSLRIQKGISQIQLAKAIEVSQTHMSNIEKGHAGISLWTALKISRVLDCSIESFADEERYDGGKEQTGEGKIDVEDLIEALRLVSWKNKRDK